MYLVVVEIVTGIVFGKTRRKEAYPGPLETVLFHSSISCQIATSFPFADQQ